MRAMPQTQLTWTKKLPTEEGWYWIRHKTGVDIVLVKKSSSGEFIARCLNWTNSWRVIAWEGSDWAGPIPKPL